MSLAVERGISGCQRVGSFTHRECVCVCVAAQVDLAKFVRREGPSLTLGGRPFFFAGFNNYYMMTRAADKNGSTRKEVTFPPEVFNLLLPHLKHTGATVERVLVGIQRGSTRVQDDCGFFT